MRKQIQKTYAHEATLSAAGAVTSRQNARQWLIFSSSEEQSTKVAMSTNYALNVPATGLSFDAADHRSFATATSMGDDTMAHYS